ncbi:NAD(P)/FAD-dependent oxidoreductase [Candidatus Protochlamydia sp. W-9]|uniref:NAD(P)/FAD-dependent oxidoreductase n=1 Tax=Candidatus Protochlamydia sp. W-9 TaxID=1785087 RepID=UPI00096A9A7A|nr:NAD(P)/FAD-dependent oxidoreductase [Candidatus Protochlamydia sp. W-9]
MSDKSLTIVVVGGGAAGFFGAISCAHHFPQHQVILLEKTRQPLAKVRISGGGRCNVTHACFDPSILIKSYPRGSQELRGPFTRFQPKDTIEWFENRGVKLKVEEDGRMFPVTDQSETIIACLQQAAREARIDIRLERAVQRIIKEEKEFILHLSNEEILICDKLLMATGSAPKLYPLLEELGHTIIPLVPSLFTFNVPDSPLLDLAGVSLPFAQVRLVDEGIMQQGPLLLTHWGFSGPAVLKLSAWAARELHTLNYKTKMEINWLPNLSEEEIRQTFSKMKRSNPAKLVMSESLFELPKQLWKRLAQLSSIDADLRWAMLSNKHLSSFITYLRASPFLIQGKTTYKQEFVTCGGVALNEVNFKTLESRRCPHLFFAGEILNIDGITGGFNFQNAWTTGWIAGCSMGMPTSVI